MVNSTDKKEKLHKIVVNDSWGSFKLSRIAIAYLKKQPEVIDLIKQGKLSNTGDISRDINFYFRDTKNRTNPALIRCVEILGREASDTEVSNLNIKKFKGDKFKIAEYDGWESVQTPNDIKWTKVKPTEDNKDKKPTNRISMENMMWVVSKSIPSVAIGTLMLKNGITVHVTCPEKNMKSGPYKLSVVCKEKETDVIPMKDVTASLVKNHRKDRKYTREQVELVMNTMSKMPQSEIEKYAKPQSAKTVSMYNNTTSYSRTGTR